MASCSPLCLRSELLSRHGFRHGFSLRGGGVSRPPFDSLNLARSVGDDPEHVAENLRRFAQAVGFDAGRLYEVSQVHGAELVRVDLELEPAQLRATQADALLASAPGSPIGVRVADCAALLLADPDSGQVAAVHAGWRGTVAQIAPRAVAALCAQAGAAPRRLLAALFPHIDVAAFEVGDDVARQVEASAHGEHDVVRRGAPKPHVDLARALSAQLRAAGLAAESIERVPGCTFSEPERFFSYRRDGAASGRHLAVIEPRC
jgi:YfiH family protein